MYILTYLAFSSNVETVSLLNVDCINKIISSCYLRLNMQQVKQCLERIEHDWTTLNGKEFEIVRQYANISRFFTLAFLFT